MQDHPRGVPDLLFDEVRDARVEALRAHLEDLDVGAGFPLHRVTVFLSYACNLRCPYCKTISRTPEELAARPQKKTTYGLDDFCALLERLGDMPIDHLHFTGGEASIVPRVVEMVAEARRRGIPHLSMTTNGTAAAQRYVELVQAGLTELRVSIDARDAALGARLTGASRAWAKSVEAVKAVAAARDAGARVRLLVNTVATAVNRAGLARIVRFLLSLGPDDVKLITDVDARDALPDFDARDEVLAELRSLLGPGDERPLLRRKLETVFARDAIGLEPTHRAREDGSWRCYIPLSERTVDGASYYPCSVYLREGGAPIGALRDSAEEQRRKSAAWVRDADCRADPICQRYCLHCTRELNDAANRARTIPHRAAVALDELRARITAAPSSGPWQPFLLFTPLAHGAEHVTRTFLESGVRPRRVVRVRDYPSAASLLYARGALTDERLKTRLAYEAAWRARTTVHDTTAWVLDDAAFAAAWRLKPSLRAAWPPEVIIHDGLELLLRHFHLPDANDVACEWARLSAIATQAPHP